MAIHVDTDDSERREAAAEMVVARQIIVHHTERPSNIVVPFLESGPGDA